MMEIYVELRCITQKTLKEADSLANLDTMVKAERLKIEVHPWWIEKAGN